MTLHRDPTALTASVVLALIAVAASGQTLSTVEHQQLLPHEVDTLDRFGFSIAQSGDTLIVGAYDDEVNSVTSGAAYAYVRTSGTWTLQARLVPDDASGGMAFGWTVVVVGDRAVIGARFDSSLAVFGGSAYVFERTGSNWTQVQKLVPSNVVDDLEFGSVLAMEDDTLFAGSLTGARGPDSLVVTVFDGSSGQFQPAQVLSYQGLPPTGSLPFIGRAIAVDGDRAAFKGTAGAIQVYERTAGIWTLQSTIDPPAESVDSTSLVLEDDLIVVGNTLAAANTGQALVYRENGGAWSLETTLVPSRAMPGARAGAALAVESGRVAVGVTELSFPQFGTGFVTVFEKVAGIWRESVTLEASDAASGDSFGSAISLEAGILAVGARNQDDSGVNAGKAYVFDLTEAPSSFCFGNGGIIAGCTPCPCGNNAPTETMGGCLNGSGSSSSLVVSGAPSVSNDSLRLELAGGNPSSFAVLISGASRAPSNPTSPCFGLGSGVAGSLLNGLRCVALDLRRHGARATDTSGVVGITNAGWGTPDAPSTGLLAQAGYAPGQTRHFQAFYREAAGAVCSSGQNTTQGVTIVGRP